MSSLISVIRCVELFMSLITHVVRDCREPLAYTWPAGCGLIFMFGMCGSASQYALKVGLSDRRNEPQIVRVVTERAASVTTLIYCSRTDH